MHSLCAARGVEKACNSMDDPIFPSLKQEIELSRRGVEIFECFRCFSTRPYTAKGLIRGNRGIDSDKRLEDCVSCRHSLTGLMSSCSKPAPFFISVFFFSYTPPHLSCLSGPVTRHTCSPPPQMRLRFRCCFTRLSPALRSQKQTLCPARGVGVGRPSKAERVGQE